MFQNEISELLVATFRGGYETSGGKYFPGLMRKRQHPSNHFNISFFGEYIRKGGMERASEGIGVAEETSVTFQSGEPGELVAR